jgi:poly-gamma-glutamate synthesis protein (capsule biosynthesis protein)
LLRARRIAVGLLLTALIVAVSADRISRDGAPPSPEPSVTLVAVGDVLLARGVGRGIDRFGTDWPFEEVAQIIGSADIAFCNLECPVSADGVRVNKPIAFKGSPKTVDALSCAGFDIVSLANNHSLDCGRTGLRETTRCLEEQGIGYVGAGEDLAQASEPVIVEVDGLEIAFLARNALLPECVWLRPDAPGVAPLDTESIERDVRDAARRSDVVIVSLHWGVEYSRVPREQQKELAHRIVDAGAELVIGHHPHVLQPIEHYHGGVIAYSLGNFVFDSPFRKCRDSAILRCRLSRDGVSDVEMIPVRIVDFRPTIVSTP